MTESGSRVSLPPHPVGVLIPLSRDRHRPGGPGERDGQRFMIGPGGRPDERVNAFLSSPRMRNRADNTSKAYAYSLGVWLNFLLSAGLNWQEATEDEVEAFQFWRLTDPRNGQPVEASSFARDVGRASRSTGGSGSGTRS